MVATLSDYSRKSLPLWQVPERFHLSILILCLSSRELAQYGVSVSSDSGEQSPRTAAMELDELVLLSSAFSRESRALNVWLNNTYRFSLRRFGRIQTEKELLEVWTSFLSCGDYRGAYWAVMSHAAATDRSREKVYREVYFRSLRSGCTASQLELRNCMLQKNLLSLDEKKTRLENEHKKQICMYCRELRRLKQEQERSNYEIDRLVRIIELYRARQATPQSNACLGASIEHLQ